MNPIPSPTSQDQVKGDAPHICVSIPPAPDKALVICPTTGQIMVEVYPSRSCTAREVADQVVSSYAAKNSCYPSGPLHDFDEVGLEHLRSFEEHVASYTSRLNLAELCGAIVAPRAYATEAAIKAAGYGVLPNYVQAVSILAAQGQAGRKAAAELNKTVLGAPGDTPALDIPAAMREAAADRHGVTLPIEPPAIPEACRAAPAFKLADMIQPWLDKHASYGEGNLTPRAIQACCPGLSHTDAYAAQETLIGMAAGIQAMGLGRISQTDVVGSGNQWKLLFAMSAMSANKVLGFVDAVRHCQPLARLMSSSADDQAALPEIPTATRAHSASR